MVQQPYAYPPAPVYVTPVPIAQFTQAQQPLEVSDPPQKKNITVKFLFFSAKPAALEIVGIILITMFLIFVGGLIAISGQWGPDLMVICGMMGLPFPLLGAFSLWKAYHYEKQKAQLLDIADFLVTYRKISFLILARKMNLPEATVRRYVNDILAFKLLDGYITPDGSEFVTKLRSEDVQTITRCPYCTNPTIWLQIIRGGSHKCPFCGGIIYFQEAVHR